MLTKTITIAGKDVTLAYCYATEVAYKDKTGVDISTYIDEAVSRIRETPSRMPDIKTSIDAIMAASTAYYESQDEESPITDRDLMNAATPQEMGAAIGTFVGLYMGFYAAPDDDKQKVKKKERKAKN